MISTDQISNYNSYNLSWHFNTATRGLLSFLATCAPFTSFPNGTVTENTANILNRPVAGSNASFTCNPGFSLSGSDPLTCQANGIWSASEPTCQSKYISNVFTFSFFKHIDEYEEELFGLKAEPTLSRPVPCSHSMLPHVLLPEAHRVVKRGHSAAK